MSSRPGGPGARPARPAGAWSKISAALWRRPWARATLLLTPPLAWFLVIYLAALVVLLITAFWETNSFTNNLERIWNLGNFSTIFSTPAYRSVILRTVGMAAGVTAVDGIVAFPFAYFMARVAPGEPGPSCTWRSCCRCGPATWPRSTPGSWSSPGTGC